MTALDGYELGLGTDSSDLARRAGAALGAYSFDLPCVCTPVPTPPPVVYVQTSGPKISSAAIALGGGIVRPFRRTEHQDFANDAGVPEVLSCVGQLLGTPIGSLPWRVDFGCGLEQLRHKPRTADLAVFAMRLVDEALKWWEPRAQVVDVTVDPTAPVNALVLIITVKIGTATKSLTISL